MNKKIWLSSPHMGGEEIEFVKEAFNSNWIAPLGPAVDGFENDIKQYLGKGVEVAALSSGTAAIHLALIMCGVKAGDEVICQSMTFSASASPIVYQGAQPVFVDSEIGTWNISPAFLMEAIEHRIRAGKKPKAIIAVHLYGMPAQIEEIESIAEQYGIPLIEDAAEALGSSLKGRPCGTFGNFSILSFNGNKIITTSGGGALVSKNETYIRHARFLATQARDAAPHYEHSSIGYNYRLSNISASIGRGQMRVLDKRVSQRRDNFEYYFRHMGSIDGISFLTEPAGFFSNRWLTTIIVDPVVTGGVTRETLRVALEKENIEARPLWKPLHIQPVFSDTKFFGSGLCEQLFDNGLCLPSGSNLDDSDKDRIIKAINKCLVPNN